MPGKREGKWRVRLVNADKLGGHSKFLLRIEQNKLHEAILFLKIYNLSAFCLDILSDHEPYISPRARHFDISEIIYIRRIYIRQKMIHKYIHMSILLWHLPRTSNIYHFSKILYTLI